MNTKNICWLAAIPMFFNVFTALAQASVEKCPEPWKCESLPYALTPSRTISIRTGYLEASPTQVFRGNILYLQGLADSMVNHRPLFEVLTAQGYRVIAFDYMGQGSSEGWMGDTRIADIGDLGKLVWARYARDTETHPAVTVIGWSTGGLAAYRLASLGQVDRVILIAPGISPKAVVRITKQSLTSERYEGGLAKSDGIADPHLQKIFPKSPALVLPFTIDLLRTAAQSRSWKIPSTVQGLALLAEEDIYVNANKTRAVLSENAAHFRVFSYAGAHHEIHNEVSEIRQKAVQDILEFLTLSL